MYIYSYGEPSCIRVVFILEAMRRNLSERLPTSTRSRWGVRLHIVPRQDKMFTTDLSDSPARSSGSHSGVRLHIVRRRDSRRWLCRSRPCICRGRCTSPGCQTCWRIGSEPLYKMTIGINIIATPDNNLKCIIDPLFADNTDLYMFSIMVKHGNDKTTSINKQV